MAIQIGTVDGLINLSSNKIISLIKAIDAFSNGGVEKAQEAGVSLGSAFQRFCEPVYKGESVTFSFDSITTPVYTKDKKEQSPSKITYCKKMGLLLIDSNNNIFQPSEIARLLLDGTISLKEYTFLLLSKQGCFIDDKYIINLFVLLSDWFKNHHIITEQEFGSFVKDVYHQTDIKKTRFDIIFNALSLCGILKAVAQGKFVLADSYAGVILDSFDKARDRITPSPIDTVPEYSSYMGALIHGLFDIRSKELSCILKNRYPNLSQAFASHSAKGNTHHTAADLSQYLRAMRTKPFLLLAGISGTGKSRIVKQMAFDSCPYNSKLRKDATTPGNYCLVEVKPNWHDSSELIGYSSQIGRPHYEVTPFVRFLAKAMLYEEQRVPFFVCLDEMNLAPVEQYFAEFLSVLESRKVVNGRITSEALIPAEIFANAKYERQLKEDLFGLEVKKVSEEEGQRVFDGELADDELAVYNILKEYGLRIPSNLIVIGTVNMDETAHQFSRKVIDRAMTIEMNLPEGDPFMDFFNNSRDLEYNDTPFSADIFLPSIVKAADAVKALADEGNEGNAEKTEWLKKEVATILTDLNAALEDTPFKIAYRVQNELMLYFHELWEENKEADWADILRESVDQILMMKVLPRIEGDEDLLEKPLASLANFCAPYTHASYKVAEMKSRLERANFTSYWP